MQEVEGSPTTKVADVTTTFQIPSKYHWGAIIDIVLHADEPPMTPIDGVVRLKYLPIFLLVKLDRMRTSQLPGLDACVIPMEPVCKSHRIRYKTSEGSDATRTVKQHQFPMTSAYAFTDYCVQGQTLPYVIVDIAKPPSGGLNLFNLYVALSRSSGRETIRLLRDFEDTLFKSTHAADLLAEDDRLLLLDGETVAWWSRIAVSKAL
ncbi:hypothetical protein PISMIDRAFT_685755 [Pisolithus microcarpus 441]|uniref:Uncharacterized protein n=1 Tax=Pisolithus microcarpus 441 TaxID=765257 RepID=A0A0C9Z3R2_9AGAM|nr:hypothetical protein PISMIDRAFT_685755 [Pisolithus microcarpus 441]